MKLLRDLIDIGAPILGTMLLGPAGPTAAGIVTDALGIGSGSTEEEIIAAFNADPQAMAKIKEAEANMAIAFRQADSKDLSTINETSRTEIANADWFVRRMRPTFGYIMAISWGAQMGAITYRIITGELAEVAVMITSFVQLMPLWLMGMSVLGLYVHHRSKDKQPPSTGLSVLGAIAKRIGGKV